VDPPSPNYYIVSGYGGQAALDVVRHPARFEKSPVIFILPAFAYRRCVIYFYLLWAFLFNARISARHLQHDPSLSLRVITRRRVIRLLGMFEPLRKIPAKDKNILRFSEASNAWRSKITGYFSKARRTSEQAEVRPLSKEHKLLERKYPLQNSRLFVKRSRN